MSAETEPTRAYDMSAYWRLVNNEGPISGTWWVTKPNSKGVQHVTPIDVVMWDEDRHAGLVLERSNFTACVKDGAVEPIQVRARHDRVTREANDRSDEIAAVVLAVAAAVDWPSDGGDNA